MFDRLRKMLSSDVSEDNSGELLVRWSEDQVDGHAVGVFEPSTETPNGVVLFLHGHGVVALRENPVFTQLFEAAGLIAVCPNGGRSWWLDLVCDDFDAGRSPQEWILESLVPWIEARWSIVPPQIALLGVSMGGQGVQQLSYRHPRTFPVVAAVSPAIDFHQLYGQNLPLDAMFETVEDARQATVVLNLNPLNWPRHQWFCCDPDDIDWFDGCARLGMKLSSSGIMHERDLETRAGGHTWDYFNRMAPAAIEHIVQGLESVDE